MEKSEKEWMRNKKKIIEEVDVTSLLKKIDAVQLTWLGHKEKIDDERLGKRRWDWISRVKWSRCKPIKKENDIVE